MGLIASAMTIMGCNAQTTKAGEGDVESFEKTIADPSVIRLDVRTPEEYAEGHIANTINIDVKDASFEQRALKALDKNRTVAVYCRSGNRSKKACQILTDNGYQVVELGSGITGWQAAGKPVTKEEVDVFTTKGGKSVALHCIKHGTLSIEVEGTWIYVDPVGEAIPPVTDYSTRPKADYILITHEHHDHLDAKAVEQLTKEGTTVIANPRSAELLGKGEVMKNGDSRILYTQWTIDAVPAYNNSPEKQQFHPKGRDNGYVLTIDGLRIYIAGDTEDIDEMQDLKDIDVAFLPCNLPFTMTPEQVAKAARTISPKVLIPYHYGQTEIHKVQTLLEDCNVDVRIRQYQ